MTTPSFRPEYVSFDCYGTLINYQTEAATRPLLAGRVPEEQMNAFMRDWRQFRYDQVCGDYYPYEQVVQDAWNRVCKKWNLEPNEDAGKQFGAALRTWGAHDGVVEPLKKMGESYKLEQLNASPEDFVHVSSHTRYDLIPADDLGFTNKVMLDRGYDPHSPAYNYTTVDSLDELNELLGL